MNHNLYVAEADKENEAIQLTRDGSADYAFAAFQGGGGLLKNQKDNGVKNYGDKNDQSQDGKEAVNQGQGGKGAKDEKEKKTRAPVTWSKDSKSFYVLRRDARGVKELHLIYSVAEPRPA